MYDVRISNLNLSISIDDFKLPEHATESIIGELKESLPDFSGQDNILTLVNKKQKKAFIIFEDNIRAINNAPSSISETLDEFFQWLSAVFKSTKIENSMNFDLNLRLIFKSSDVLPGIQTVLPKLLPIIGSDKTRIEHIGIVSERNEDEMDFRLGIQDEVDDEGNKIGFRVQILTSFESETVDVDGLETIIDILKEDLNEYIEKLPAFLDFFKK